MEARELFASKDLLALVSGHWNAVWLIVHVVVCRLAAQTLIIVILHWIVRMKQIHAVVLVR